MTAEEWGACIEADGNCYRGASGQRRLPIANVSWDETQAYLNWLNTQSGGGTALVSTGGAGPYRLPSEAEWEYAARAGMPTAYSFGDDPSNLGEHAWFRDNAEGQPHEVGGKRANQFGLFDLHGNVWEWVQDCYASSYADLPTSGSAYAIDNCSRRVLRGGAWDTTPRYLRTANRPRLNYLMRHDRSAFRVARIV